MEDVTLVDVTVAAVSNEAQVVMNCIDSQTN